MDVPEDFQSCLDTTRQILSRFEQTGELNRAQKCINQALLMQPTHSGAWLLKSQLMSAMEDDLSALAASEMARTQDPDSPHVLYVRATVLSDLNRYDEALESISAALRSTTESSEWLAEDLFFERASIYSTLGDDKKALAAYEEGLRRFPESVLLRSGMEPLQLDTKRHRFRVIDGGR